MKPHNKGLVRILCPQGLQFLLIIAIHTTLISLKNLVLAWAIEFLFSSRSEKSQCFLIRFWSLIWRKENCSKSIDFEHLADKIPS